MSFINLRIFFLTNHKVEYSVACCVASCTDPLGINRWEAIKSLFELPSSEMRVESRKQGNAIPPKFLKTKLYKYCLRKSRYIIC